MKWFKSLLEWWPAIFSLSFYLVFWVMIHVGFFESDCWEEYLLGIVSYIFLIAIMSITQYLRVRGFYRKNPEMYSTHAPNYSWLEIVMHGIIVEVISVCSIIISMPLTWILFGLSFLYILKKMVKEEIVSYSCLREMKMKHRIQNDESDLK